MILIYDCETTGLPLFHKPSSDPEQPQLIQLAALMVDIGFNIQQEFKVNIKPEGWEVPADITALTGLTQQQLEQTGTPLAEAMENFLDFSSLAEMLIGHNEGFDRRMVRISLKRLKSPESVLEGWKGLKGFDTCLEGQKVTGNKRPTLAELYRYFEGKDPEQVHNAPADCLTTLAVYRSLKQKAGRFDKYAGLRVAK